MQMHLLFSLDLLAMTNINEERFSSMPGKGPNINGKLRG